MSVTVYAQTNAAGRSQKFELPGASTGWKLRYEDQYLAGNFDQNGRVYAIVVNTDRQRIGVMEKSQEGLIVIWKAGPQLDPLETNAIGWPIHRGDAYYVGDFDGDGQDELLAVSELQRAFALIKYAADVGLRATGVALGEIQGTNGVPPLTISSGQQRVVGDYDGDGAAEVCVFDTEQGSATIIKWVEGSFRAVANAQGTTTGLSWALHQRNKAYVGAFRGENRDELLVKDEPGTSLGLVVWEQNTLKAESIVPGVVPFSGSNAGGWPLQWGDSLTPGRFTGHPGTEVFISSRDGEWIGLLRWETDRLVTVWMVNKSIRGRLYLIPGKTNKILIPKDESVSIPGLPMMSAREFASRFEIPKIPRKPSSKKLQPGAGGKDGDISVELPKVEIDLEPSLPLGPSIPGITFPSKDDFIVVDMPTDIDVGTPVWNEWNLLIGDRFFAADFVGNGRDQVLTTRALGDEIALFEILDDRPLLLDSKTGCVPEAGQVGSCGWPLRRYDRVYVGFGAGTRSEFIMGSRDDSLLGNFALSGSALALSQLQISLMWARRDWIADAGDGLARCLTIDVAEIRSLLGDARSVTIDPSPDPTKTKVIVTFLAYRIVREGWYCGDPLSYRKYATRIFDVSEGSLAINDILEATGGWLPSDLEILYVESAAPLSYSGELAEQVREVAESLVGDSETTTISTVVVSKRSCTRLGVDVCLLIDVPFWPPHYGARIGYTVDIIPGSSGPVAEATISVSVEPGLFSDEIKNNIEGALSEAASREQNPIDSVETVEDIIESSMGPLLPAQVAPLVLYGTPVSTHWTTWYDLNTGMIIPG